MDLFDRILGIARDTASQAKAGELGAVTVESAAAPAFTIRPLGQDGAGGFSLGGLIGKLLRPRITVQTPVGPIVQAPYGDPPAFPWVGVAAGVGLAGMAALAGYGVYKLVTS